MSGDTGLSSYTTFVDAPQGLAQSGSGGTSGGASGKAGTQQVQEMMHKERMKEQQGSRLRKDSATALAKKKGGHAFKSREEKERQHGNRGLFSRQRWYIVMSGEYGYKPLARRALDVTELRNLDSSRLGFFTLR